MVPKIDAHAHVTGAKAAYVEFMDAVGMKAAVNISWGDFAEPEAIEAYERALREDLDTYPERFRYCASFNTTRYAEPGYADGVIAKLDRDIREYGAVAVKVWKDLGMMLRDAQGRYVFCDDSHFTPIFDFLVEQGVIIHMHIADPVAAWKPLDPDCPHYGYFKGHPEFHWYNQPNRPSHDEILAHRDALVARYPQATFVCAHLASLAHDVDRVAALLDRFPNAHVDSSGRWQDLARQPDEEVRAFFSRYQDRLFYGADWDTDASEFSPDSDERGRQIEKRASTFQQSFDYFERRLELPDEVLEKFYFANAAGLFGLA